MALSRPALPPTPLPCRFHENEKVAKFIMLTLNLEFVVYFEKSSFSWYVQLKGICYYSLIKSSQLNRWGESELCTAFVIFKVVICSVYFSGLSCYMIYKILQNIMAHIRRTAYLISDKSPWISILYLIIKLQNNFMEAYLFVFALWESVDKNPHFWWGERSFFFKTNKILNFQAKQNKHV